MEENQKEKLENIRDLEDYSKIINKQEVDRLNQKQIWLNKMNNIMENYTQSIKIDENKIKINEENFF